MSCLKIQDNKNGSILPWKICTKKKIARAPFLNPFHPLGLRPHSTCWLPNPNLNVFRSLSIGDEPKLVLSRRQIIASLEEEISPSPTSSPPTQQIFSRSCLLHQLSQDEGSDSFSSSLESSDNEYLEDNSSEDGNSVDNENLMEFLCENNNILTGDQIIKRLKWVATLGVGGFGRVELVKIDTNQNCAFALKKIKKNEVETLNRNPKYSNW